MDIHNNSSRQKISYYCTPKTNNIKIGKSKDKKTDKPASVKMLPLSIPAKFPKEINEISKFFKAKTLVYTTEKHNMLYAQVSKSGSNTKNVLKIKEVFSTLKANNINKIQNMTRGNNKPKPQINITTKGLSRKQIIIPMNNENKNNFIRESSAHIINMNRALKISK